MGHDLPAALGSATAAKNDCNQRVICFAGDGSVQMNIQELQTLKTTGLNIIVIILNNEGYLSIWQTHENFFGRVIGATPASGVEFPDYAAVAHAYGLRAERIKDASDLSNDEDGSACQEVVEEKIKTLFELWNSRKDDK